MAKMITLLKEVDEEKVKTPQIRVILKTLAGLAEVGTPVVYQELLKAVDANPEFISRQGAMKVVRFYEKPMVEQDLVSLEGTDKPEAKPKPPAKAIVGDGEEKPKSERKASKRAKAEHGEHQHAAE